jgi:hypothetical protein
MLVLASHSLHHVSYFPHHTSLSTLHSAHFTYYTSLHYTSLIMLHHFTLHSQEKADSSSFNIHCRSPSLHLVLITFTRRFSSETSQDFTRQGNAAHATPSCPAFAVHFRRPIMTAYRCNAYHRSNARIQMKKNCNCWCGICSDLGHYVCLCEVCEVLEFRGFRGNRQ